MGTYSRHSKIGAAVCGGVQIFILVAGFAGSGLQAQTPYYSTASGKSTTFGFYDPLNPPAPKAPSTLLLPSTQPALPTVSASQYAANKAAIAPYSQPSFSAPPQVQISPIMVRAPGTSPASPIVQIPTVSFQGIQESYPQFQPASPDIAAGPSDVLMVVNSSIAQFTKTGTEETVTSFQNFFGALLPAICSGTFPCLIYDPSIRYDQLHGRFVFLATLRNNNFTAGYLLLSVTNGATYASGWKTWVLNASLDGNTLTTNWADFWRVGFDDTAVYLSGNMYNQASFFQYAKIRVVLKSDLYNVSATTLPYQDAFNLQNADGSLADTIIPVHQRGNPTSRNSQLLLNTTTINVPATYITVWQIADPTANPLLLKRTTVTGLKSYNYPALAPQLNGVLNEQLDSGDSRILKAVYRDGFLYTARNTGYTDPGLATTVTYDVIETSNMTLVSQAWLVNQNAFYPAFDVPASTPRGAPFATANLITGTTTAPNGSLTYAGVSNLVAGQDLFDVNGGEAVDRWGDYFGGAVDPVTGGLWASGAYAETRFPSSIVASAFAGQWGTWTGYFPWLTVSVFADVPSSNVYSDYINVLSLWQITSGCSATTFCPTDMVLRSQIAVFLIRSLLGDPCPSNTPCSTGFTYTATPYFMDVPATSVYFPYIQKLADLGITTGCSPTTFCPDDSVTRAQAAVFLVRGKLKSLFGNNFTYPLIASFTDVAATDVYFPYIQKLFELGITSGCSATQFCPDRTLTRQEIAVFVVRGFVN
jgi:hypothetical protein